MTYYRFILSISTVFAIVIATPTYASPSNWELNSEAIAIDLSENPDDPILNYLRAFAYERNSISSTEARELARVGYVMALRKDSGMWQASYQLGLMALEDGDPFAATRQLLYTAQKTPANVNVFRALARAAYCLGDIELAKAAISKADLLGTEEREDYLLTNALIASALQDKLRLQKFMPLLSPFDFEAVNNRLADPRKILSLLPSPAPSVESDFASALRKRMAVADVVVIRRSESSSVSSGINLLDSLSLQLGSELINKGSAKSTDLIDPTLSTNTTKSISGYGLTIPAVTYALNLANAKGNTSTIEARPILIITDGAESKFFNGGTLTFSNEGTDGGSSDSREVGISVSLMPKFIGEREVNISVAITLETFLPKVLSGTFRQAVETEKSSTQVDANLQFGQTILLSMASRGGLGSSYSKTPIIGDIPILGNLFHTKLNTRSFTEFLMLLSLRPIPNQSNQSESDVDKRFNATLRSHLFPDLQERILLEPETRQMFYRIENPAHIGREDVFDSIMIKAAIKKYIIRR